MKIYVATHNPDDIGIVKDSLYEPIFVGSYGKKSSGILRDDSGKNISKMNPSFCELTALYWIWKNSKEDVVGLCHYRRYLSKKSFPNDKSDIITEKDILNCLDNGYNFILPKKEFRLKKMSSFGIAPNASDMEYIKSIIKSLSPEYLPAYAEFCEHHYEYLCNIMVCNKKLFDQYCEWLFKILFEAKEEIPLSQYANDPYRKRLFGFISERLLNVWIIKNRDILKIKEYDVFKTDEKRSMQLKKKCKQSIEKCLYGYELRKDKK